jgi:predicted metal-dependent hydrolase
MMKQTSSIDVANAFKERVHAWAVKVRVKPKQVRLQAMRRKWASCSTEGRVSFSLDLLQEPGSFQDYVIVHELIHLKVPNHGKLFASLLAAHLPNCKYRRSPVEDRGKYPD